MPDQLTPAQVARVRNEVKLNRYPERDRVMVLLSVNAGLRAIEISTVTWGMVLDVEGNVGEVLELRDGATKGERGGPPIDRAAKCFGGTTKQANAAEGGSSQCH